MHPTEEELELLALGRLVDPALSNTEDHLLMCEGCRHRQVGWDDYIASMIGVLREAVPAYN